MGDLNNNLFSSFHIQSDSGGCLFNTQKIISTENLWYAGERARERAREREKNCNEDVLTTGNLVVLQLEFPLRSASWFYLHWCLLRSSLLLEQRGWRMLSAFEITSVPATRAGPDERVWNSMWKSISLSSHLASPKHSFMSKQQTRGCCVHVRTFNTLHTMRDSEHGGLALSLINPCKFRQHYGQNTLKLFSLDMKA